MMPVKLTAHDRKWQCILVEGIPLKSLSDTDFKRTFTMVAVLKPELVVYDSGHKESFDCRLLKLINNFWGENKGNHNREGGLPDM